jgi:acyl-CoA thioesterase-2
LFACIGFVASFQGASLDHTIWFHLRSQATEWHWFDTRSYGLFGAHGLTTDDVL